jgi:hypothetical protein
VRIRRTTRPGASLRTISMTTATESSIPSGHGWAPSPAILLSGGLAATPRGLGAGLAPDTARTIPLTLRHTITDGEVRA